MPPRARKLAKRTAIGADWPRTSMLRRARGSPRFAIPGKGRSPWWNQETDWQLTPGMVGQRTAPLDAGSAREA